MFAGNSKKVAIALAFCVLSTFAWAPAANASSALDQYVEEVPTTEGEKNPGDKGNGQGGTKVKPERSKQLKSKGKDGEALVAIAESTGPGSGPPGAEGAIVGAGVGEEGSAANPANAAPVKTNIERRASATKSFAALADVSSFSVPLFAFVIMLAAGMGALAWRRRGLSS